uniref:Inosine triphosphate pyrophosphatase n=1 Tax=Mesocestoides corti TaxID=53468 RepID=A0A5K3FS27_MESCO
MLSVCGRAGCRFPIEVDRIICRACSLPFHHTAKSNNNSPTESSPTSAKISRLDSPQVISYVTSNPNKLRETSEILGEQYSNMLKQVNIDLPEYQGTIEEIAQLKCRYAAEKVDGPVLVEDTSLGFDALKGMPGPYIKWFLKAVGPEGLYKMQVGFGPENNGAEAICTFAYSSGKDRPVRLFQGVTRGRIVEPRGVSRFGWDPCFQPDEGHGQTYAEMDKELKNAISHRFKAANKLREFLKSRLTSGSTS